MSRRALAEQRRRGSLREIEEVGVEDPDWQREGEDHSLSRSKVVGVSFKNDDGTSRQNVIRNCHANEVVRLVRDYRNPKSDHAIRIVDSNGQMLGHLNEFRARQIAGIMDRGQPYMAVISVITGGGEHPLGANLIVYASEDTPRASRRGPESSIVVFFRTVWLLIKAVFALIFLVIIAVVAYAIYESATSHTRPAPKPTPAVDPQPK